MNAPVLCGIVAIISIFTFLFCIKTKGLLLLIRPDVLLLANTLSTFIYVIMIYENPKYSNNNLNKVAQLFSLKISNKNIGRIVLCVVIVSAMYTTHSLVQNIKQNKV